MAEDQNRPYRAEEIFTGAPGMYDVKIDGHVVVPGVTYGTAMWLAEKLNQAFQRGRLSGVMEAEERAAQILGEGPGAHRA